MRILIADDDDIDRRRVRRALKEAQLACEVAEAATVPEMLCVLGEGAFDCAIIDYNMPGENGLAGISAIRARAPDMPVVMVTGQGDEMVAREALNLGASDYIPKDKLDGEALRRTIEAAQSKRALERKLEKRLAEQESFAKVLVHDLSAPISSTCLVASEIKECLARGETKDIGFFCDQILSLAQNMGALIDNLHAHTKLDEQAPFEPLDAETALTSALGNLAAAIEQKGARVSFGTLPRITGCAPQLTQLLQNLIGNAIKYCEAETPTVRVEAEKTEKGWRISVTDNGIGVPEEYRARIFQPFERLHTQSQYSGTGLGLATCKKIVERHGGEIGCDAAPSGGSIFSFTLADHP